MRTATVDALGLQLTVRVSSLAPSPTPSATAPLIVLVGGVLLSLLAGSLALVLVQSRRRALSIAGDAIAEARVSEDEMRKSAARFASLVRRSSDVIAIVDPAGFVQFVTPSIQRLLAVPPSRIEGTCLFDYVVFDEQHVLHDLLDEVAAGEEVTSPAELVLLRADGAKRWLEVRASNLMDDPNVGGIVLNGRDVTERRAFQDALTYEATHDRLTELPNRAQFLQILSRAVEHTIGGGRSLAVLFVDVDHFKVVNDSLGHGVGDALLVAVARRLVGAVRSTDPVARLGGDEFVVVCEGVDLAGAKMVAQHVLAACRGSLRDRRPRAACHGEHRHRVRRACERVRRGDPAQRGHRDVRGKGRRPRVRAGVRRQREGGHRAATRHRARPAQGVGAG